jgi:ureidoglycolate amidohydrolase
MTQSGLRSRPLPLSAMSAAWSDSSQRLQQQLSALRDFSDDPYPAVTRVLFTENDVRAREYVKGLMKEAGLDVRVDGMGSLVGTWRVGTDPQSSHGGDPVRIMTGSHTDAIPLAGAYDGTVGVLGGIEAIRVLKEAYARQGVGMHGHPVEFQAIMFTSEEPTRFGMSCVSSRVMAGVMGANEVAALRDSEGLSFVEAGNRAGVDVSVEGIEGVRRAYAGAREKTYFVELHIEQGKELEEDGLDIGIVTHIAAPAALVVSFEGPGGHAGGLLMKYRHDASLAASELAIAVEELVLEEASIDTVGTVGSWKVEPNAVNSVPRHVELGIDVRDVDGERLARIVEGVRRKAKEIAEARGVAYTVAIVNQDKPATSSPQVVSAVGSAVAALNLTSKRMVSRAYHDSLFMGMISEMGMIFIPCEGGKSHRPDEFAREEHITQGVQTLALAMGKLAGFEFENDDDMDGLHHDDQNHDEL